MFFVISCQPQDLAIHCGGGSGGDCDCGCTSTSNLMINIYTSAPIEIHGSCMHTHIHLGMTWFDLHATRTSWIMDNGTAMAGFAHRSCVYFHVQEKS